MKFLKPKLFLTFFLFLLFFDFLYAQDSNQIKEYYPLQDGNAWTYAVTGKDGQITTKKIIIEGKKIVDGREVIKVDLPDLNEMAYFYISEGEGVKVYKYINDDGSYKINDTRGLKFPFDLDAARDYDNTHSYKKYDKDGNLLYEAIDKATIQFVGREDVEVPAGKFTDCLKFNCIFRWEAEDGKSHGEQACTSWFAYGTGKVKESCVESVIVDTQTVEELTSAVIEGEQIGS